MLRMARAAHIADGHVALNGHPFVDRSDGCAGTLGEVISFADGKEVVELQQDATTSAALEACFKAGLGVRSFVGRRVMRIKNGKCGIVMSAVCRIIIVIRKGIVMEIRIQGRGWSSHLSPATLIGIVMWAVFGVIIVK